MKSWKIYLILGFILMLTPLWAGSYFIYMLSLVLVMSIAAVGLDVLMGYAGQICFGQAGFMAVGAYTTAYMVNHGLSFWIALPIGGILSGLAGLAIGLPSLRITGHYLALATMAFASIIYFILLHWESVTGGPRGMQALRPDWPISFAEDTHFFFLILLVTIAMVAIAKNIVSSKYGRAFISLQKNEIVSKSMGINLLRYKTLAFIISSFYGGIAGGLYGPLIGFLDPLSFSMIESAYLLLIVLLGGRGTIYGPILGALLFLSIPELARRAELFQEVIYGTIFLVILIYMPSGLIGIFKKYKSFCIEQLGKIEFFNQLFRRLESKYNVNNLSAPPESIQRKLSISGPERSGNSFLQVKNVTMRFGGLVALYDLSFELQEGKIFSLIGPNGAGKTTALNTITRIYDPQSGEVLLRGENLLGVGPDRIAERGISRTFQNLGLFEGLSVLENVMVGLHPFGQSGFFQTAVKSRTARQEEAWEKGKAMEMLHLVNLENDAFLVATDLPYGKQNLVGIARALVSEPRLLILDEPAAGLSSKEKEHLTKLIRHLRDEKECSILLVEHDMDIVMGVSDHILVLNFGQKIAEGKPDEIRYNPLVIEAYLGEEEVDECLALET